MFNLDIILIDLTLNNDFEKIIIDNNLSNLIKPEALQSFKNGGYLKIWVDIKSIEVVAFTSIHKKGMIINNDFMTYLKEMRPLKEGKEIKKESVFNSDLTIDTILDKISASGIKSLTKEEYSFLKKNN